MTGACYRGGMEDGLLRSFVLRFFAGAAGRVRCRITDPSRQQTWVLPDASELYGTLRALAPEDPSQPSTFDALS
jgi:hypothetical protein